MKTIYCNSTFVRRAWPLLGMAAVALMMVRAEATNIVSRAAVGSGNAWTNAVNVWSNTVSGVIAEAPIPGNTYELKFNGTLFGAGNGNGGNTRTRNPAIAGVQTFAGDSLTLGTNTEIRAKTVGAILNFPGVGGNPGLILDGGMLNAGDDTIFEIRGKINVASDSVICPANNGLQNSLWLRGFKFNAALTGAGSLLVIQGTNNPAVPTVDVGSTSNSYSGTWVVKAGLLKGTAAGALGSGNILINPLYSVPSSLVNMTNPAPAGLSNGPAVFEVTYNHVSTGTLTIVSGGFGSRMNLHQDVGFSAATINGTALTTGTHPYSELTNSFPSNFAAGGSGSITVGAPPSPTGVLAIGGDTQVRLAWAATPAANSYWVLSSTTPGGPYTPIANVTSLLYTNTGLVNGTTVYYVIQATNVNGGGGFSAEVSATPNPIVQGLTATGGTGQIALAWSAFSGATSYTVKRSGNSGGPYSTTVASGVTDLFYTDTTVANGTTYYYVIEAVGTPSNPSLEAVATTAPGAPVLTSTTLFAGTVTRITWTFSDPVISGFAIEQDSGSGFAQIASAAANWRAYTNSGLAAATAYSYRVRATNNTGSSPYSNVGSVTTTPLGSININFATAAAPVPPGYLVDTGAVYSAQQGGLTYGWDRNITADTRLRTLGVTPPDIRYATLVHMIKATPPAFWEITVPNGFYSVRIVGGDQENADEVLQYEVEGLATATIIPNQPGSFLNNWADVTSDAWVQDGKLTIRSGPNSQTIANNNKIDFIDIYPATPVPITIGPDPQSQNIEQGRTLSLTVTVTGGSFPRRFQWLHDGVEVLNQTNQTLTIPRITLDDNGGYSVQIFNPAGSIESGQALVSVFADVTAPTITNTYSFDGANIKVVWNESMDPASATDFNNYQVSGGTVTAAQLLANGGASNIVVLSVSGLASTTYTVGVTPTLSIADIFGNNQTGNPLANGKVAFPGSGLTDDGIIGTPGNPLEPGSTTIGSITLVAGGSDIWGTDDHFRYAYGQRTGDFDVKVRVSRLDPTNQFSKAGFVIRQDLTAGSPTLGVVITPHELAGDGGGIGANDFEAGVRATLNGSTVDWGARPTNSAPWTNAWIRVKRSGTTFKAYYNTNDGLAWAQFATNSSSLPGTVYVGLGATAHNNGAGSTTTATFENFANVVGPTITSQPTSVITNIGSSVTFSVAATGTVTPTYQWRKNGGNIGGATGSSYTIASAQVGDAATYDVVVTGELDSTTTSSAATLSVINSPVSVQTNVNSTVNFSVTATGSGPFTYQWKKNGSDIGATAATLTLNNVQAGDETSYAVVVGNGAGSVTSSAATLSLYRDYGDAPDPSYPTLLANNGARHLIALGFRLGSAIDSEADGQPDSTATGDDLAGSDDEDGVTFLSAVAQGRTVRIQVSASAVGKLDAWMDFNANGSWADAGEQIFTSQTLAAGVNDLTFVVPMTATVGNAFARFRLSSAGGLAVTGEAADGEVEDYQVAIGAAIPPTIVSQPQSRTNCNGTAASFSVTADGVAPVTYQWFHNTNTLIMGANSATYSIPSVGTADAGSYTVVVTDGFSSTTSADAFLTVNELTTATTLADVGRCVGQSLNLSTVASGTGPFTYTWKKGTTTVQGPDANASYTIASVVLGNSGVYSVEVQGTCNTVTNSATVSVSETIAVAGPANSFGCVGQPVTLSTVVTGVSPVSYTWKKGAMVLATTPSYTIPSVSLADAGTYTVEVVGACNSVTNSATLAVSSAIAATTTPTNATRCEGQSVTFSTTVTGSSEAIYLLKKGEEVLVMTPFQAPATLIMVLPSVDLSDAGTYTVEVEGGCNSVTNSSVLTVNQQIALAAPANVTVCQNQSATLTAVVTGVSPVSYTWKKGATVVQGPSANNSYTIPSVTLTDAGVYTVEAVGACNAATNSGTLTVNPLPAVTVNSAPICPGGSTTLTATTDASSPTYLWSPGGSNTASIVVSPSSTTTYTCLVTDGVTGCTNSASGTVTVQVVTTAALSSTGTNICPGLSVTLTATAAGTGPFTYTFLKAGVPVQGPGTANTYVLNGVTSGDSASYSVDIAGVCNTASATAAVSVVTAPVITANPQNFNGFYGNSATFSVTATSGAPQSYQWYSNNVIVAGATGSSYTINGLLCPYSGSSYSVIVSNCAGTTPSTAAILNVQPSSSVYFDFNNTNSFKNNFQVSIPGLLPTGFTYSNSVSGGIGGTPDIDFGGSAGGGDSTAVFQNNAYDFSYSGAVLNISMLVKIKAPSNNNRALQIGFLNRPSTLTGERLTAFMSLRLSSTNQPALGYNLQTQSKVNVGSGTIDGSIPPFVTLIAGNWYKISATFTNFKATVANSYTISGSLQDMGTDGQTPGAVVFTQPAVTNVNADIANDSSVFAAFRGLDNAGADAYENLSIWINSGAARIVCDPTNQTVLQGRPYVIRAYVDGAPPFTYQWYKDDVLIPGATDWQITNSAAAPTDGGAYKLVVNGTVASAAGTLIVSSDTTGPSLVSAGSFDGWNIGVLFNEKVDPTTATDPANYIVTGGPAVASARLRPDGQSVILGLAGGLTGAYTVQASNVKDLFNNAGSSSASGSVNTAGLTLVDINNPIPKGSVATLADGEYEITAGGRDVWGGTGAPYGDQFSFAYLQKTGDFDVRVKVTNEIYNIGSGGQITKAGLLARESLSPGSRNIDMYVTPAWPGLNRYEAGLRSIPYGDTAGWGIAGDPSNQGNVAANHPTSWLRLRRVGDTFTAYTGSDGINWTANAQTTVGFSNTLYVGLMMCAHNATYSTTAPGYYFSSTANFQQFGTTPVSGTSPVINITSNLLPGTTNLNAFQSAVFTMGATISGAPTSELQYQWQRSDGGGGFTNVPMASSASATYTTPALPSSAAGSMWRCVVSAAGALSVTSSVSTVTTITDAVGPTISQAYMPTGAVQQVVVIFSEPVSVGTADVAANYNVTNATLASVGVNSASFFGSDGQTILLSLAAPLVNGTINGVVVNNVRDRSSGANAIAANAFKQFAASIPLSVSNVVVERFLQNASSIRDSGDGSAPRGWVDALMAETKFINNAPDFVNYTNSFGWNTAINDSTVNNYGGRVTSYFTPLTNGQYRFYTRSDDLNRLYMNTNAMDSADPAGKVIIADQNIACCKNYGDTSGGPNVSPVITLVAGQQYYIEGLFKEGIGGDGFEMAFRDLTSDPSGVAPPNTEVASSRFFTLPTGPATVTTITPAAITVPENGYANFSVKGISGALPWKFQWFQGATLIPGATALSNFTAGPFALTDTSVTFVMSNQFSRASISAAVTVTPDAAAPTAIRAVGDLNFTNVTISFSERVTQASAENIGNYSIPGLAVLGATLQPNGSNVVLRTSTQTQGLTYIITINNIQDRAATPNTILAGSTIGFTAWVESFTSIKVELFLNNIALPGPKTTVPDLLMEPKFINNQPDIVLWTNIFAWNQNIANSGRDNYGGRITAYFVPPRNGVYRFYIRSDDLSELHMNPCGTDPSQKITIASQDIACCKNYGDLTGGPNVSSGYPLAGGQKYYMEALFKEGIGGDGFTMAWREAGDTSTPPNSEAASAINFASVDNGDTIAAAIGIAQQPVDAGTVPAYHTATFTVVATNTGNFSIGYQWFKNAIPIPLANNPSYTTPPLLLTDNGALYTVRATIPGHAAYSTPASVNVVPDNDGPILATGYGDPIQTHVRVVFNETVAVLGATNPANYGFSGGQVATNASLLADGKTVVLALDSLINPGTYTVTAGNIFDLAGNALAADTTPSFSAPWVCTNNVLLREEYFGNATAIPAAYFFSTLTNNPTFPNNPGYVDYLLTGFNSPQSAPNIDNFSTRVTGYIIPPVSGNYYFQVHADDSGWLQISQDAGAENKKTLIRAEGACAACNNPQNGPVALQAGYAYYVEGMMMEGAGGDYIDVSWRPPGAGSFTIIPAANLAYCLNPDIVSLEITAQPTDQTVLERRTATFTAAAVGTGRIFYQWQFFDMTVGDWANVPGGTNTTLRVTPTDAAAQNGTLYRLAASLGTGLVERNALSDPATLFVNDDILSPVVVSTYSLAGKTIKVVFNEDLDYATATDPGSYPDAIGASHVTGITLAADNAGVSNTVLLTLDTELTSPTFTVTGNTADGGLNFGTFSGNGNVFALGTWLIDDGPVGTPLDPIEKGSTEVPDPNRLVVTAGGSDIWNAADGFRYAWGTYTNDFDVKVRVSRIDPRSRWSKAGFVVRESFAANGRHLSAVLTPAPTNALDGSGATVNDFEAGYRPTDGAAITDWGNYVGTRPTNAAPYTNAWMRMNRVGNTFTAYYGTNGIDWTPFATTNQAFASIVYFGLATTAHNNSPGMTTTVEYNNFARILPPSVVTPPLSQAVVEGGMATFNVVATGEQPLSYQWRKAGSPIGGATGSSYTVLNAQLGDAVDYDVVINNLVGSATSAAAHLTVVVPTSVVLSGNSYSGGQFTASVQTQNGLTYKLQYKNALTDPSWTTVATIVGDGNIMNLVDPGPLPPVRFYQVKIE